MSDRNTKYSVPDGHWDEDEEEEEEREEEDSPTHVDSHSVDVIYTTDPHETGGYGREKYTAVIMHGDDGPSVIYFRRFRWKGNYWREVEHLDWKDVPGSVRQQVAEVVDCSGVESLSPGTRLVDEGGEKPWQDEERGAK